jgi:hypothetical protein
MKVLKGIMCFILSAEWLGDDDADAVERAVDPLQSAGASRIRFSSVRAMGGTEPFSSHVNPSRTL